MGQEKDFLYKNTRNVVPILNCQYYSKISAKPEAGKKLILKCFNH